MNVDHYTYRVMWSGEDEEFIATVAEFPSLSWLAESRSDALEGIVALVRDVVADMEEQGEEVPVPLGERAYSGEFRVRIPPSLHRELAAAAHEEGVSLNRLVSHRLAHA